MKKRAGNEVHFKIQSFSIHLANSFLVALLQGCKNLCCVGFCVYLGEYVGNHPVFVYHKGGADNSHISLATHLLLAPSTKGLDGGGFHVGKQVEGQFKLFPELGVGSGAVLTDSQNYCSLGKNLVVHVTKATGLCGAARSVVLGIKINHYFLALEISR